VRTTEGRSIDIAPKLSSFNVAMVSKRSPSPERATTVVAPRPGFSR